jgi:hypothetical protein
MTRARGQPSRTLLNREYPHQVLVLAETVGGKTLDRVIAFHDRARVPTKSRSARRNDKWHLRYCFAERRHAVVANCSTVRLHVETAPYRSGPSRTWIKVKNPKAPAATRVLDGTF